MNPSVKKAKLILQKSIQTNQITKTTCRTISTKTISKLDSQKVQIENKNSWLETVELNLVVQIKKDSY